MPSFFSRTIVITITLVVVMWAIASLSAVFLPFILSSVFAYITAPLANFLEQKKFSPTTSALSIVGLLLLILILLPIILLPVIVSQIQQISQLLPAIIELIQKHISKDIFQNITSDINWQSIGMDNMQQAFNYFSHFFGSGISIMLTFLSVVTITPLGVFYLIRDRKMIGGELTEIFPPAIREKTFNISKEIDSVLGEFLHGQLLVMLIMVILYSMVLTIVGLQFSLTIGIISGLLIFIPYIGFIIGLSLAILVSITHFNGWTEIFMIIIFMGIVNTIESLIITPKLVGERVGLHPLLVLLALMVMGSLLGFIGVLLAVPVAAILLVCLRHLRRYYISSKFYYGQ